MRLLLDTHTFLWLTAGDSRLTPAARGHIQNLNNQAFVSIVTLWEIAIKVALGKLALTMPLPDLFAASVEGNNLHLLPLDRPHVLQVALLPLIHRDPFDRILIAQALAEGMSLVSTDAISIHTGSHASGNRS